MFDGVPFFVLGTRYLGCQFGNESDQKMSIYLDLKDSPSGQCEAKREKCPAKIILKEVIKFPHYKIDSNTSYEKKKWSKLVRDGLCKGTVKTERRIYVELPKSDAHVHTITWKTSGIVTAMPTHCLVCNARLSSSTRATVSLFSDGVRTSHRQLEVASVLSSIVNQELVASDLHSTMICSKCFNLIDDIDALEEQLSSKKQHVMDKFERTMVEVNGKAELNEDAGDELDNQDDQPYGKRPRVERKRGRPPGRSRGRGSYRSRGRPRTSGLQKSQSSRSVVKIEVDQDKLEDLTATYVTEVTSPPSLKTIKKEDIMNDLESSIEHEDCMNEEEETEGIVAVVGPSGENMVEQVSVELQGDVLEVVGEVLEEEKKQNKMFSCSECDKQFLSKAAVRNHIKVHSHLDSYDCLDCEKSFSTKYNLQAHLKTHENREKIHECKACGKSFYTTYQLSTHLKSHAGHRNFVCDVCGKSLSTQKTLELHALTHSGEKPFQCEICGATFRQRSNLHTHIKATHYQEKNHHCHICQKSFVRKRLLVYHMNSIHTGERPYKCELCSATFVYPHYYKRHLRKHTGDKPHKCHVCSKQFTSRENRNSHLFTHSNKRPYECKICGAGFMRKPLCVTHVAAHGSGGAPEEYIVFNSPSMMLTAAPQASLPEETLILPDDTEPERTVQTVRMVGGTVTQEAGDETAQIYTMRDDKVVKVMSRSGYIIEAEDNTRYVIHTTDRGRDEHMDHFFAAIQGQVVEVRTEDF